MRLPVRTISAAFCYAALTLLMACGTPRPPLPPSLELPRPVTDLRAARKANKVTLVWTVPIKTMDKTNLRHIGPTLVCRSLELAINRCDPVGTVQPSEIPPAKPAPPAKSKNKGDKNAMSPVLLTYTDTLSASLEEKNPAGFVTYAVETQNSDARSAGLSNQVQVPLVPTLPPPSDVSATVTGDGVSLAWTGVLPEIQSPGVSYTYRIYRRDHDSKVAIIAGEVPLSLAAQPRFLDSGMEWQKTYDYWISVVSVYSQSRTSVFQVEGNDSTPIELTVKDVFPPATPNGLQAVSSGEGQQPFIDLTWAPNSEADLAGYYVYRRRGPGDWTRITSDPLKTPNFRDNDVVRGNEYQYSVSAVDLRGNESPRSEETAESVR